MGVVVIFVMWPIYFVYMLSTLHKESSHEIWVQLGQCLWENYVLIYWWDSNMSDLSGKVKGLNLDFWNLFIAIVSSS